MDIKLTPSRLEGKIRAISSKSDAHRILIAAALSDKKYLSGIFRNAVFDETTAGSKTKI